MLESQIQKNIIAEYEKAGWLVVKIIQTNKNGWPDLQCHKDGITIFIECKKKGCKLSPLQIYRHQELQKQGFKVIVIKK